MKEKDEMFEYLVERAKTTEELFEIVLCRLNYVEQENAKLEAKIEFMHKELRAAERRAG